jgi:DNA-nicking Smr family endonuclease
VREHRLSAEESALWARVIASVEPLEGRVISAPPSPTSLDPSEVEGRISRTAEPRPSTTLGTSGKSGPSSPTNTLDGSWDRKLTRGTVQPDLTVDLHGHTLDTAYHTLDAGLERAKAQGARVLLLVTGKPREPGSGRGAIRAAVGDWLSSSRHAANIAAVRGAHPRHGGTGALYIILKRPR